jgi:hypothetical protein
MGDEHMIFIFDIDGVLADVTHLLPLITGASKDYEAYYARIREAGVIYGIAPILQGIQKHHDVFFITGRRESSREDTIQWLQVNGFCGENPSLYMRHEGNFEPAHKVKERHLREICTDVAFGDVTVFEDDPHCAEMYESLGCYVCHVKHEKARS